MFVFFNLSLFPLLSVICLHIMSPVHHLVCAFANMLTLAFYIEYICCHYNMVYVI